MPILHSVVQRTEVPKHYHSPSITKKNTPCTAPVPSGLPAVRSIDSYTAPDPCGLQSSARSEPRAISKQDSLRSFAGILSGCGPGTSRGPVTLMELGRNAASHIARTLSCALHTSWHFAVSESLFSPRTSARKERRDASLWHVRYTVRTNTPNTASVSFNATNCGKIRLSTDSPQSGPPWTVLKTLTKWPWRQPSRNQVVWGTRTKRDAPSGEDFLKCSEFRQRFAESCLDARCSAPLGPTVCGNVLLQHDWTVNDSVDEPC